MKKFTLLILASTALLGSLSSLQAAVVLDVAQDTYFRGNGDGPFGSDNEIRVKTDTNGINADEGNTRVTYLQFDLSSLSQPVQSASLELTAFTNDLASDFTVWGLTDESQEGWSETGTGQLDNSNAPAFNDLDAATDQGAFQTGNVTELGSFNLGGSVSSNTAISFSGTGTAMADFLNADTDNLVTFLITRDVAASSGNGGLEMWSKEGAVSENNSALAPDLEITVIPEPSAAALILGVLAGALVIRRRRG